MGRGNDMANLFRGIDSGDLHTLDRMCLPGMTYVSPMGEVQGLEAYKGFAAAIYVAMPDLRHTMGTTVESGDMVAFEVELAGTFTGPLRSPEGEIPPTGKPILFRGADFVRFEDGKVAWWRTYFDPDVFAQLGVA